MVRLRNTIMKAIFCALPATLATSCTYAEDIRPPQDIDIRQDAYGVPYIIAGDEADGFYALGYVQARDRLDHILRTYLRAEGRLSEVEGPSSLADDIYRRTFFSITEAREAFSDLSPRLQKSLEAFVAGIQAYMAENPDLVPEWAPNFGPEHVVLHAAQRVVEPGRELSDCRYNGIWFGLGLDWPQEVMENRPYFMDYPTALEQSRRFTNASDTEESNGAGLSPDRTAMNRAVLISDSHSGGLGGSLYEFVMRTDQYNLAGVTNPGTFLTIPGNSDSVSWGATSGGVDSGDCYVFNLTDDGAAYTYGNGTRDVFTQTETYKVQGTDDVTLTHDYVVHNDLHSPVIAKENGRAYALVHANRTDVGSAIAASYAIATAGSVAEAIELSAGIGTETRIYADVSGSIGVVRSGRAPVRPEGYNFTRPLPAQPETEWMSYHSTDKYVQIVDPESGFFHANNEEPYTWSGDGAINPLDYPEELISVEIGFGFNPFTQKVRGQRFFELLNNAADLSEEQIKSIATDTYLPTWNKWRNALRSDFMDRSKWSASERHFYNQLVAFDGFLDNDSIEGARVAVWFETLFDDAFSPLAAARIIRNVLSEDSVRPTDIRWIEASIPRAAKEFEKRARGVDDGSKALKEIVLGDFYRIQTPEGRHDLPLRPGAFELLKHENGGRELDFTLATASAYRFGKPDKNNIKSLTGGALRTRISIMTTPPTIFSVMPWGQSNDPSSPHYADQMSLASERDFKRVFTLKEDIVNNTELVQQIQRPASTD